MEKKFDVPKKRLGLITACCIYYVDYLFPDKDYCCCAEAANTRGFESYKSLPAIRDAIWHIRSTDPKLRERSEYFFNYLLEMQRNEGASEGKCCLRMKYAFQKIKEMLESGEISIIE